MMLVGLGCDNKTEIDFSVQNWDAVFKIRGKSKGLEYYFSNASTYTSGAYFYDDASYYLIGMSLSSHRDLSRGVMIPLNPLISNRITFTASTIDNEGNTNIIYQLDTVVLVDDYVVQIGQTKVMVEEPQFKQPAQLTALEIETIRKLMPANYIQLAVFQSFNHQDSLEIMMSLNMSYSDSVIYGTVAVLEDSILRLTKPFHEMAHAYFERSLSKKCSVEMAKLYAKAIATTNYEAYPNFSLLGPPNDIEKESVFSLFDESNYVIDRVSSISNYGHPYSNEGELFASASTVLRHFSADFSSKLAAMKAHDPRLGKLAEKIVCVVKRAYGKDASVIFP